MVCGTLYVPHWKYRCFYIMLVHRTETPFLSDFFKTLSWTLCIGDVLPFSLILSLYAWLGSLAQWLRRRLLRHTIKHIHRVLIIKATKCTNFSNLFLELNSTCFGQFLCPSSGIFRCKHAMVYVMQVPSWSCSQAEQQACMTYNIAVCTVKNSWWCTEELSETCCLFQK
jgi:hypothetical protein